MFESIRCAGTVAPSASSTLRIGGDWSSASITVPPRVGWEVSPEPRPASDDDQRRERQRSGDQQPRDSTPTAHVHVSASGPRRAPYRRRGLR